LRVRITRVFNRFAVGEKTGPAQSEPSSSSSASEGSESSEESSGESEEEVPEGQE
jgi:hypothetical protein